MRKILTTLCFVCTIPMLADQPLIYIEEMALYSEERAGKNYILLRPSRHSPSAECPALIAVKPESRHNANMPQNIPDQSRIPGVSPAKDTIMYITTNHSRRVKGKVII